MATDRKRRPDPTATERKRRQRLKEQTGREIMFARPDWAAFLRSDRLPQKAGCPPERLRAMVLKELADNALDAGADVTIEQVDDDTWVVADAGSGLDRGEIVRLFAVDRPMTSTKFLRRPTRGALGNGLRVVTGGVLASGGVLAVESRGVRCVLDVDRTTGSTVVREETASGVRRGVRVTVAFGPALRRGKDDGWMARLAARCAGPAAEPMRSSPAWYDAGAFAELIHDAEPGATVADVAALMGVTLDDDRPAAEADLELLKARAGRPPVLVPLGADRFPGSYAKERGHHRGVPVLAEAWVTAKRCSPSRGRGTVVLLANRSPVAAPVQIASGVDAGRLAIFGANLNFVIGNVPAGGSYEVVLAVTSPAIPVTTEGKEPDLRSSWGVIEPALAKAMRAAHRSSLGAGRRHGDIKEACYHVMERAYLKASAGGVLPANARQVYYAARPLVQELLGPEVELSDAYFTKTLLPDFVAENPALAGGWDVVFDPRGSLHEPHTGLILPVGTLQVREYLRPHGHKHRGLLAVDAALYPTRGPRHRFNTLLYIEKKGFGELMRRAQIPERFDCAVMSTEGMSVTEARRLVDHHARQGVTVLVAHDFDRSGACIAWTVGNDTRRYAFEVAPNVVDLGLSLAEAQAMDLDDEAAPKGGPGEERLREYGLEPEEIGFLIDRRRRVELNAMPSDQFVRWIEAKLVAHGGGKVVPPSEVLEQHARRLLARRRAAAVIEPLIGEMEAAAACAALPADLAAQVRQEQALDPALPWESALERALADVTLDAGA